MVDKTVIEAAQDAFLKIDNEDQRRSFIDWCRRETDKMFFGDVRKATDEGMEELKNVFGKAGDTAKKVGAKAVDAGRSLIDSAMKDFLGDKKEGV